LVPESWSFGQVCGAVRRDPSRSVQDLLIITPLRNEAAHLDRVITAMAAQTRRPDEWVVVDDGSTDTTRATLERRAGELGFMRIVDAPPEQPPDGVPDRLAVAGPSRAFNAGLRAARTRRWDFIGKLDGDVELPPDYFERMLERFAAEPELGIAGGTLIEPRPHGDWRRVRVPEHHVPGAVKLYRAECFARIGGVRELLGWDTIDEMYARMHGYRTRSFRDLVARHHRPTGAADGVLRGRARHGACAWIAHYPAYFVVLRALKLATVPPRGASGAAFAYGYLRAALRSTPRVDDPAFRTHVHAELARRVTFSGGRL
jgi:poly-beta-1,6-N-acetyl-D-glucosamine synthase